ncbi:MAG: transporter substrate-binding protein [Aeromicrobium sp.]|jgi:spermidine/putrescine transport system substrate-binding protein|nr:transporter substrate-binding protein [Aeromicrobium sp.]
MAELDRRTLLKGAGGVGFGAISLAALKWGFNAPDRKQDPATCKATDLSDTQKRFVISNWPEYIDEDDGKYVSTLSEFEKETGIKVSYTADVNDNNEFFAKVSNQLGSCSSSKRDMFVLTDWMAARMIQVGWIQKLDASKVPNLHDNIIDSLAAPGWDKKRDYSAPWQSGLTGIAYNKKKVKEVKSFQELLTRSDLKGRVSLLTEMRDTMGFALLAVGADPAKFTDADWQKAIESMRKAKRDGQVRAFTGNDYVQDLSAGNVLAAEAWSGDIANAGDDNLVWIPPEEGVMIWADNMLVPNLATHKSNAEKWINYYYEPEVAAKLAAYNSYICPVKGAQEAMKKVDKDQVDNELIFPTEKTLSISHRFMALDEFQNRTYEKDFSDVTGS